MPNAPLTTRPAWQALRAHQATIRDVTLKELFAKDAARGTRMTLEGAGVYLDYSKNRITDETLRLLLQLAEQSGLRERIDASWSTSTSRLLAASWAGYIRSREE